MEIIMNNFLDKLNSYDLFTLQSRIYTKLLSFVYGIKNNKSFPSELKEQIFQNTPSTSAKESQSQVVQETYYLRNGPKKKKVIHKIKYELLTFGYFFLKLLKTFNSFDFSLSLEAFKTHFFLNLPACLKIFLETFTKFDVNYSTSSFGILVCCH